MECELPLIASLGSDQLVLVRSNNTNTCSTGYELARGRPVEPRDEYGLKDGRKEFTSRAVIQTPLFVQRTPGSFLKGIRKPHIYPAGVEEELVGIKQKCRCTSSPNVLLKTCQLLGSSAFLPVTGVERLSRPPVSHPPFHPLFLFGSWGLFVHNISGESSSAS